MWPLRNRTSVLRAGRECVELWRREASGLVLSGQEPVSVQEGVPALAHALQALLAQAQTLDIDVVLESAWMPVLPLDAGPTLWSIAQMDALLAHRLAHVYRDERDAQIAWMRKLDYRQGDPFGIGYAITPAVHAAVEQAAAARGGRWRSLQPAFGWGWRELAASRRRALAAAASACWIWQEQDRALVAGVRDGRIVALHPAADLPRDEAASLRLATIESHRAGADARAACIVVAGWDSAAPSEAESATIGLCLAAAASKAAPAAAPVASGTTA